jgi:hypothetical protein
MGKWLQPLPAEEIPDDPFVVFGHATFGYHKLLPGDYDLFTVVRHPAQRIVSEYLWWLRSRAVKPADAPFEAFLDNYARHNYLARCLLPEKPLFFGSDSIALERLRGFKYLCTTETMQIALSNVFSERDGPSIRVLKGKVSVSSLKEELVERYFGAIEARNHIDLLLYQAALRRDIENAELHAVFASYPKRPVAAFVRAQGGKRAEILRKANLAAP